MTPAIQYLPPGNARGLSFQATAGIHQKKAKSHEYHARNETEIEWQLPDPCVTFWRAVLLQQVKAASNKAGSTADEIAREDAIIWLRGCKDFEMVCELADLPFDKTLVAIQAALTNGIKFRLPKGQGPRAKRRKGYAQ